MMNYCALAWTIIQSPMDFNLSTRAARFRMYDKYAYSQTFKTTKSNKKSLSKTVVMQGDYPHPK
jgi:hypothetical protein